MYSCFCSRSYTEDVGPYRCVIAITVLAYNGGSPSRRLCNMIPRELTHFPLQWWIQ